jgi:hypothetical protein
MPAQPIRARGRDSGPVRQWHRLASPDQARRSPLPRPEASPPRLEEDIMHLMFVRLFLETGTDDLLALIARERS